ncbi:MFS transporter [Paraburkholderia sp. GAS334]|uniref:MFS transporter n=1 Tax=Paraburkholderia sp. GAS334 TaxID=3035131 RepID=UPI003D23BA29
MTSRQTTPWRAIAALNVVSMLSQIGQFGMGFIVLPVWLVHQGIDAPRAGLFSAAQWAGILAGLLAAPPLVERFGPRSTVLAGLASSIVAFATMGMLGWPLWMAPGALIGFGIGLRWIANETWLYSLVPAESSGRVVGFHETLIATAGVIAPAFAAWCGVDGRMTFIAGAAFTFAAAIPLCLTGSAWSPASAQKAVPRLADKPSARIGTLVSFGMLVGVVAGLSDGTLYGLFPLFAAGRGLGNTQTATLLMLFGVGAMAFQYPVGWLADRAGLTASVIAFGAADTLAIIAFGFAAPSSVSQLICAILLGGMSTALLTLSMYAVAAGDTATLARSMRLVSLAFTASSIAGPLVAGVVMQALGSDSLMWQLAITSGALAVYALGIWQGRRQPAQSPSAG